MPNLFEKIMKQGKLRCNMREYNIREDGCCNTISTVIKDNYILEVLDDTSTEI